MTRDEIVSVGFDFCGDYKIIEHYASHLQDINFESFKPVMMAALRSLLPKDWSTAHETAWEWLWTTVARNLKEATMKVRAFRPLNAELFSSLQAMGESVLVFSVLDDLDAVF
jgi:hypothetical protein